MSHHDTLRELDDAHQRARDAAAMRMEQAEDCVAYYRSQMSHLQDAFFELARVEGFLDAEGFRAEMQTVSDRTDQNLWEAGRVLTRFADEDGEMLFQQRLEREQFVEQK